MKQPEGFMEKEESMVCKLKKSIYGLKQSARCWNTELNKQIKNMGFKQCSSDPCIYVRDLAGIFILAIYVDDIILAGENTEVIDDIKKRISEKFDVKDMGKLHHFLGVKIIQNVQTGEIWIGQPNYTIELLSRFKMDESKPAETPVDFNSKLIKTKEEEKLCNKEIYQSAIGSLLYLSTRTRPDISFAVGNAARYCAQPSDSHWSAVKRIMRYLKGTLKLGLLYKCNNGGELVGFSDADWAGDLNDRKSTSGYIFLVSGSVVSWKSKKQSCVALSTAEAEYMSLASAAQEAIWMRRLINDIMNDEDNKSTKATIIYEDNQSAISMSRNPQYHGRAKHIDIKFHFVREQVTENHIELIYCKSEDMVADILTKAICGPQFKRLRGMMGMKNEIDITSTIEEEC